MAHSDRPPVNVTARLLGDPPPGRTPWSGLQEPEPTAARPAVRGLEANFGDLTPSLSRRPSGDTTMARKPAPGAEAPPVVASGAEPFGEEAGPGDSPGPSVRQDRTLAEAGAETEGNSSQPPMAQGVEGGDQDRPAFRPVEPMAFEDTTPKVPDTGPPICELVDPRTLLINPAYQRDLAPAGVKLIRKMIEHWSWAKFTPPICSLGPEGLEVLDGQHTAIAAASNPNIPEILVVIVETEDQADRAEAFIGHNVDRTQVPAIQLHFARGAAGDAEALGVDRMAAAGGVTLVRSAYGGRPWKAGETTSISGLRWLLKRCGEGRGRMILEALAAAGLAPITDLHMRAADMIFSQVEYAQDVDPLPDGGAEALTAAIVKAGADAIHRARTLIAAKPRTPLYEGLGVQWFKAMRKRKRT